MEVGSGGPGSVVPRKTSGDLTPGWWFFAPTMHPDSSPAMMTNVINCFFIAYSFSSIFSFAICHLSFVIALCAARINGKRKMVQCFANQVLGAVNPPRVVNEYFVFANPPIGRWGWFKSDLPPW